METLIKQLESFNEQIQAIDDFSNKKDDDELIGIRFYRFIQNNPILKKEFDRRAKYFLNLTHNEEYLEVEKNLIRIAQESAMLFKNSRKELNEISKLYGEIFCYLKPDILKEGDLKWITIADYITRMQEKKDFVCLGDDLAGRDTEKSIFVRTDRLERQFESIGEKISILYLRTKNETLKNKLLEKDKKYEEYHLKFIEKMKNTPSEINQKAFEKIYLFVLSIDCVEATKMGCPYYYGSYFAGGSGSNSSNNRFRDIKKYCATVINELIFYLRGLEEKNKVLQEKKGLKSIHLVTHTLGAHDTIFLVLDEHYDMPIRYAVKNKKGEDAYIKKLYNIAYFVDAPDKKVNYNRNIADGINNGLFRKRPVAKYVKTNKFKKPTLVQKSENGTLVLKSEILVKTGLVKNDVPLQFQSLYIDKTR